MNGLLEDLDFAVYDAPPSPDMPRRKSRPSSPVKSPSKRSPRKQPLKTPTKQHRSTVSASPSKLKSSGLSIELTNATLTEKTDNGHSEDMDKLCEGAGDWDWNDMNSDFMTPKKSPVKHAKVSPKYSRTHWDSYPVQKQYTALDRLPALQTEAQGPSKATPPYKREPCTRCVVKDVKEVFVDGKTYKVRDCAT